MSCTVFWSVYLSSSLFLGIIVFLLCLCLVSNLGANVTCSLRSRSGDSSAKLRVAILWFPAFVLGALDSGT